MNNNLGQRIRLMREELDMSQLDLAKKLNIGNSTLSQYESGKRIPSDEIKIKLAELFNVSIDYLLGITNIRKPSSGKINTKAYHNLDFDGLSDEDIKKVEDYVEFIKSKYNHDGTLKEDNKNSKK